MAEDSNASTKDPRKVWVPPPRPEWVSRLNEEGRCMDIRAVVPLEPDSLINSAIRHTGYSDLGVDDWREPFEVLCRSFDEDADLNLMGRIRVRHELLVLLQNRLQVEAAYKQHPDIENEEIEVIDSISLEIPDNLEVGRQDPLAPAEITKRLKTNGVDAIVASACVQMPSLPSVQLIEDRTGLPVVSSSVSTTYMMLRKLGLKTASPGFGSLLSGRY